MKRNPAYRWKYIDLLDKVSSFKRLPDYVDSEGFLSPDERSDWELEGDYWCIGDMWEHYAGGICKEVKFIKGALFIDERKKLWTLVE